MPPITAQARTTCAQDKRRACFFYFFSSCHFFSLFFFGGGRATACLAWAGVLRGRDASRGSYWSVGLPWRESRATRFLSEMSVSRDGLPMKGPPAMNHEGQAKLQPPPSSAGVLGAWPAQNLIIRPSSQQEWNRAHTGRRSSAGRAVGTEDLDGSASWSQREATLNLVYKTASDTRVPSRLDPARRLGGGILPGVQCREVCGVVFISPVTVKTHGSCSFQGSGLGVLNDQKKKRTIILNDRTPSRGQRHQSTHFGLPRKTQQGRLKLLQVPLSQRCCAAWRGKKSHLSPGRVMGVEQPWS